MTCVQNTTCSRFCALLLLVLVSLYSRPEVALPTLRNGSGYCTFAYWFPALVLVRRLASHWMNRSYTCARCQNGCRPTIQAHLNGDCVSRSSTHECNFAGYDFRVGLHRDLNLKVTRCFYPRVPCMVLFCFVNRVERISHMYFLDVLFEGTCYHGCLLFAASALNFQAFCLNAPRGQVVGSYGKEKIKNIKQHAKT